MTEEEQGGMSEEQYNALAKQIQEENISTQGFFKKVVEDEDTTKTGNVDKEELGNGSFTVRGTKELEVFCRDIANEEEWADYFKKLGETQLATSLSKEGFLLRNVNTQKREMADTTPQQKENKGWFGMNKKREE